MRQRIGLDVDQQRLGAQPGLREQSFGNECVAESAGTGEVRQEQRIRPQCEARTESRDGAGARSARPVQPEYDQRRELRSSRERQQADRGKRRRLVRGLEVKISERGDADDGSPTNVHENARVVLALRQAEHLDAHQSRNDDLVTDHRRQRYACDDDHAGRGRETTEERQHGQQGMLALHGQGKDEGVSAEFTGRQDLESGNRYRNDESGKYQQVERE